MQLARASLSLFGVIAVVAVIIATATVWLLLTDPVMVADSVNSGQVTPFVRQLGEVLYQALSGLLRYL